MATYTELRDMLDAVVRAAKNGGAQPNGALLNAAERLIATAKQNDRRPARWTPLQRAVLPPLGVNKRAVLTALFTQHGIPLDQMDAHIEDAISGEVWINQIYQVIKRQQDDGAVYLSIRRIDQAPVRSWRDLQRIKNQLVGPENEAIELYPAESRLVDTANQYHLFAHPDPTYRFPFGISDTRLVTDEFGIGERQEPLETAPL